MRSSFMRRTLFAFVVVGASVIINGSVAGDAKDFCKSLGIYSSGPMIPCLSSASTLTDDEKEQTKLYGSCEEILTAGLRRINSDLMEMIIDSYGSQNNIAYARIALHEIDRIYKAIGNYNDETKVRFFWMIRDMEHKAEIADQLHTFLSVDTWNSLLTKDQIVYAIKRSVKLDKIVEHERYNTLFTSYVNWLSQSKNPMDVACKESTLMAILEFIDQRRISNGIPEEQFTNYLFGKICAKTYTTKFGSQPNHEAAHINDANYLLKDLEIKELITNEKIIDAPISVLKTILEPVDEYVEAMGTRKWIYPSICAEIGQCKTERCAKLTFKIIHLGSKTNLSLRYFRNFVEQAFNANIMRDDALQFLVALLKIEGNPLTSLWFIDDIKSLIALYNWQKIPENPWVEIEGLIKTSVELKWSRDFLWSFLKRTENIKLYAKYYKSFLKVVGKTESYMITSVLDLLENANIRDHTLWDRIDKKNLKLNLVDLANLSKTSREAKDTLHYFLTNLDISSCAVSVLTEIANCVNERDHFTHFFYFQVFEMACTSTSTRPISNQQMKELFKAAQNIVSSKGENVRMK